MTGGALSEVLLRFASQFVGRFRGGLGHTNILAITFFSGISGSALADAAGPGAIMIRMMRNDGYHPEYAAALTAAVSILGPIIPPSITHDHLCARISGDQSRRADDRRCGAGHRDRGRDGGDQSRRLDASQLPRRRRDTSALADYLAQHVAGAARARAAGVDPGRHRVGRVHADRGERRRGVLRARGRALDLPVARVADAAVDSGALGADDGVGADHRRDVGGVRVGAHGLARPAADDRADRRGEPVAARVPVRRQRAAARVRHFHRAAAGRRRAGPDPCADRARARHQRSAVRHHRHREPDDGHDHAAGRRTAVRDVGGRHACR